MTQGAVCDRHSSQTRQAMGEKTSQACTREYVPSYILNISHIKRINLNFDPLGQHEDYEKIKTAVMSSQKPKKAKRLIWSFYTIVHIPCAWKQGFNDLAAANDDRYKT